jgi:hypothetical protein
MGLDIEHITDGKKEAPRGSGLNSRSPFYTTNNPIGCLLADEAMVAALTSKSILNERFNCAIACTNLARASN